MAKEVKIRFIELAAGLAVYFGWLAGAHYDYWNLAVTEEMKLALVLLAYAVLAADACWQILKKLRHRQLFEENFLMLLATGGALYAGINADGSVLTALGISGALAGLGGAVQILGMSGRLSQFAGQEGFGFEGITVALIGSSSPIGCIFSGLFYGAMKYGGSKLSIVKAPSEVVDIIMGCVILFIAVSQIFRILFARFTKKKEA